MQDFANKKIVLGISGGIAAYKSAFLVRELTRLGAEVRVVMSDAAQEFITPMTLQALSGHDVRTTLFDSQAERAMGHIELARWADYLLIAPASANCLAKMAHGLADDLLSTLYLVAEVPVIVCPAMNRSMWAHTATQANVAELKRRGVFVVGPEEGSQACGEEGVGRMSDVHTILDVVRLCDVQRLLSGRRVLITAGPTREAIDPVRYMSNRSSGKMGYALAQAAQIAGADVTLVSGPVSLIPPSGVKMHCVQSAQQMHEKVMALLMPGMIFIGAAAVSDYRLTSVSSEKIKKQGSKHFSLDFDLNPDILADVAASGKAAYTVGFAAETHDVVQHAQEKLNKKKLDMIIANEVGVGLGFDVERNQVVILAKDKQQKAFALAHKTRLAGQIIAFIAESLHNHAS